MSANFFDRLNLTEEQKEILIQRVDELGNVKEKYRKLSQDTVLKNAGIVANRHQLRNAVNAIKKQNTPADPNKSTLTPSRKPEEKENKPPLNFIENNMTVNEVIKFLKEKSKYGVLDAAIESFIEEQEINGLTYNSTTLINETSLEKHLKKIRSCGIYDAVSKKANSS